MTLYKDLTARDLFLRRCTINSSSSTSTSKDTGWEFSGLIRAALKGRIAVLDNIDRISPSALSSLSSLIQDREVNHPLPPLHPPLYIIYHII